MPWEAWLFIRAIVDRSPGHLLAAAILLFASITSNAQVAIKMAILAVSWAPVEAVCCHGVPWRRGIAYCTGMLVAPGSWAAFLLALAMALPGFCWLLYFAVVSNLKPSAWVGITHARLGHFADAGAGGAVWLRRPVADCAVDKGARPGSGLRSGGGGPGRTQLLPQPFGHSVV